MKHPWVTRQFDVVELGLLVLAAALLTFLLARQFNPQDIVSARDPERAELMRQYGPDRNSEHEEEWIIRDFFRDKRNGVFVDVGANDYRFLSNTYYLETMLGWSGLAIEPQRKFADGYRLHRPRSTFLPFFVSDRSNENATLFFTDDNSLVTSSNRSFVERFGKAHEIHTPTITMDDLLRHEKIDRFDFLNMDIELAEPIALKGFTIEQFRPALVCIEAHPEVRQQILDYFEAHHYVIVGKYLRVDTANLYFAPAP